MFKPSATGGESTLGQPSSACWTQHERGEASRITLSRLNNHPVTPPPETLAELLSETLNDGELWGMLAVWKTTPASERDRLAAQAYELYAKTAPFLGVLFDGERDWDEAEPMLVAAMAIRVLADAAAITSHDWQADEWGGSFQPPERERVEAMIRIFGVAEWAAALGSPLQLHTPVEFEGDLLRSDLVGSDDGQTARLAIDVAAGLKLYGHVMDNLSSPPLRQFLRSERFRETALKVIGGGRWWVFWTRQNASLEAQDAAVVLSLMAEAMFIVSVPYHREGDLVPTKQQVREFLRDTDALDWLIAEGPDLPLWVMEADEVG